MKTNAYIFIGQSGSGKGTQAALLDQKLQAVKPEDRLLHLETGTLFRSFIQTSSFTAQQTKSFIDTGKIPPSFIGVHVWSHELIAQYDGQEQVIIDGAPRVSEEVPVLLSAARFYDWNLHVIYIDVSDAWAHERLLGRGRADDVDEAERAGRLQWFHDSVMPGIKILEQTSDVQFITINGERPIEDIHADIATQLGL